MTGNLVIVGAGLAGAKAAEAARAEGWDGRIVLVGDEPTAPYERPPLSKAILRGEAEPVSARIHPAGFYRDHDIELVTGDVARVDVPARRVVLTGGQALGFDTLVVATGAEPRRLPAPWDGMYGVHHLRTMEDALRLHDALQHATRVAVIGAGWIGSEVTASARQMGVPVVLIDPLPTPLARVLGPDIGAAFARRHADHGVDLRLGCTVAAPLGSGRIEGVRLDDGRIEPADVVVAGIGVTPRTPMIDGLGVRDGIVVDQHLQTSVAGVFAAGDVASAFHPRYGRHIRVEHWANALNQGAAAGANAAGRNVVYDRLPYFFSDMYDDGLEYVGHAGADHDLVVRGDLADDAFIAFWHRGGIVDAAMHLNVWDSIDGLKEIVASAAPVDLSRLADPTAELAG